MHLALNLLVTHETEFLDRRSLAASFEGSSEQDISTRASRTEEGQENTSAMYSISHYMKKSVLLLSAMYLLMLKENTLQ